MSLWRIWRTLVLDGLKAARVPGMCVCGSPVNNARGDGREWERMMAKSKVAAIQNKPKVTGGSWGVQMPRINAMATACTSMYAPRLGQ